MKQEQISYNDWPDIVHGYDWDKTFEENIKELLTACLSAEWVKERFNGIEVVDGYLTFFIDCGTEASEQGQFSYIVARFLDNNWSEIYAESRAGDSRWKLGQYKGYRVVRN